MRAVAFLLLTVVGICVASSAQARVQRFAIVVGSNRGNPNEEVLRYAESDASRVYDVLRDLGGFDPADMVLLRDESAPVVEQTLIAFNDRIRTAMSLPNTQAFLMVYYSGHADQDALHLGGSVLPLVQLAQLVRGSAATFRLLVLDACRSGALTRVKGGRITAPFALDGNERMANEGLAFLTASASHENAQESDEIQGSFFTHALLSGLLGAADTDGDGVVVLDEAYRYAYDATLRATSRSSTGLQHPTFQYDLRGRGDLVLTRTTAASGKRGRVRLPPKIGFLVTSGGPEGPVVFELGPETPARVLSVRAGSYFVRGMGDDYLLEGVVDVAAGTTSDVEVERLKRVEYARLVRKGARPSRLSHGPQVGFLVRSPLPNAERACIGAMAGYALDFEAVSTALRFARCTSESHATFVDTAVTEYDLEAHLGRALDVHPLTFELGIGSGLALFTQQFDALKKTPSRISAVPFFGVDISATVSLFRGLYAGVSGTAATYLMRLQDSKADPDRLTASVALRGFVLVGKQL